jgi:subtilisin-like proprotein convertase family protein
MRTRPFIWILLCLLCLAGAWLLWHQPANTRTKPSALQKVAAPAVTTVRSASTAPNILTAVSTNGATSAKTNQFAYRLSNTTKTIGQLVGDRHAILLENALIDTGSPLNFSIPAHLQSQGDPGAYVVQARGPIDAAFRAMLAAAGAEIVSYIPNNAYLVRAQAGVANGLASNPLTQAVTPYEPYYKIQSSLLIPAMGQMDLPDGAALNLGLFGDNAQQTIQEIEKLGGKVLAQDRSPFGPIVRVVPPKDWVALATLPGVQIVEPYRQRLHGNDLSRVTTGVSTDALVPTNYMNLSGSNVLVEVNDFGIDALHPDLTGRVFGSPTNLVDSDGHGTHVAGIIAGNGSKSSTVTSASGSIVPGTDGQFRGKAQLAKLLSMNLNLSSDRELQEAAARTNALISNNSWYYEGDANYDLAAASYDAAVRDALPERTGSQPVLFVFAAGNNGGGDNSSDPGGGNPDTILSPATAKNVITVGALQEFRNVTNVVTTISADGVTNTGTPWQPETSTSYRMAGFSSRGNVGIGIEGTSGRFKPDVVAPGTFVISTRSEQWDVASYFYINPTNHDVNGFGNLVLQPGALWANVFPIVPANAVQAAIFVVRNADSPDPFPDLAVYFGLASAAAYTDSTINNQVLIPPDGGLTIADILSTESFYGFNYAVSNTTTQPISFDVFTDLVTTNNPGDYFLVLSNLNQSIGTFNPGNSSPGPYYRYESGTSMSAADVSGVLALMQDYFTNTLHAAPSPVLLKAMLINGARATGFYNFHPQNAINYEGWGLINLPNSLPPGITMNVNKATGEAMLMLDQNPAAALATGDSHTFLVKITNTNALTLPLRITLAWTDPPGDPAAAIKLVNDLNLVVSNSDAGLVYYGNDIPASSTFNSAENGTNAPIYDSINNVENVYLQPGSGANFSVTVQGYRVNVNAVTAHTNNVVQDYVLVISSGNGEVTNAFTVTDNGITNNPTADQQITFVTSTNTPLLNQFVGASTPLLGTNTIPLTNNGAQLNGIQLTGTNILTLGMTNQWHFYVVKNTTGFTNAAFITFLPPTLSLPRMGVFAGSAGNATRPEADIDLYVSTNSALTNLDPTVISGADKSVGRGGTEFVAYNNSTMNQVYYIGVYSEDQEASEYGFIPIFSQQPFSQMNPNGSQSVFGVPVPVDIPDGTPARPGHGYVFGLALYPIEVQSVIVTDTIVHQNFGDLIGTLNHGGQNGLSRTIVLNNHVSLGNPPGPYTIIYDDSGQGDIVGSQPTSGPGSLNTFTGQQGNGVWLLTETDDSLTQTGSAIGFNLLIEPHQDATKGIYGTVGPLGWKRDFIDVPPGTTNLTISATNLTGTGQLDLYVKFGSIPTLTDTNEFGPAGLTNGIPPGNSITINSPVPGRYWWGLYNNSLNPQDFYLIAKLGLGAAPQATFTSAGSVPILDDAVMTDSIYVPEAQTISSVDVALRVDHSRVSDLVFHLTSPDGTRVLLVENRGGKTTNGMGASLGITNIVPVMSSGDGSPSTNVINTVSSNGTVQITYNFYTVPDEMVVFNQGGNLIFDSGIISGSGVFNIAYTNSSMLTIVMNPYVNPGPGDLWDYTVNSSQATYTYLVLTEDTNKTTTPIKFAPTPFVPALTNMSPGVGWINWPASAGGNGHWYKAVATNVFTWTECDQIAHDEGGYLATITSAAENAFVFSLVDDPAFFEGPSGNGSGPALGGIRTNGVIGVPPYTTGWSWETGESWGYTNWRQSPLEPDNCCGGQSNLVFFSNSQGVPAATWDDIGAADHNIGGYVIERDAALAGNDLYYLPEQSLDTLAGENAQGQWQLEIWDNRAGAGLTNTLASWQLRFNFPTASSPVGPITNGLPQTNTIPAGGLAWYQVNVPVNADFATNILIFATGPLNVWFGTNSPTTNVFLFSGTNGSYTLSTTGTPPLVPGSTYYLGVQNTNSFAVTYGIEVDFHYLPGISGPFAFTQPAQSVTGASAQLNGMATPNGLPATAWFQWGTNTFYGNQTPPVSVGTGSNVVYTASQISGLLPNVPYHFRLVVSNALAVVHGFDQILDEANVVVWGANYAGQAKVPSGLSNVVAIAGAYDHSLALKNNETAVAWGDNLYGEATVPAGLSNLVAVAGGESYSVALQNNEMVVAWGSDIYPGAGETNVPSGLNNVVMIASGQYSSLALQNNGTVTAWGASLFNPTNIPAGLSNVVEIAGGTLHSLAIKNDGTVMAWGDNGAGQTNVPANLTNVVAIAAGSFHSLALKSDGTVVAWGFDSAGQTNVPANLTNVVAVAAGGFHSMALKNDGSVVAWGDDSAGQTSVPVGLSNVVAIASGYLHSMALTPLFNVNSTNPIVLNATNGVPQTNSILAGGITWYQVNVPTNADFATNILLFTLNGPLNVWLGTNSPATNVFLFSGTNGSYTLSTTGTPPLVPGSTYYLGVQNTNSFAVTYGIEVDFHLTSGSITGSITGLTITAANIGGTNGFLLQWQGPTNFQYEIQWTTSLAPVVWNTVLNPVINVVVTSTNGHYSFFDDGTLTGGFGPMKFYRVLGGLNLGPITGPGPATNTVLAGSMSQAVVAVPANAISASNLLISATGPLNVWFNQTNPPTGNTNAGDFLMLSATSAGAFVLTSNSVPPLVPGTNYYLGIQNPGTSNVTFVFQVAFGFAPIIAVSNFSVTTTNGGIWLQWNGLTNYQYQVQWTTSLAPAAAWNTISNIVLTSTTGVFTFFDDGSLTGGFGPMKFYRLIAWPFMTPIPQILSISSVTVTNSAGTNDLVLKWSAPTNYHYKIQWTTNLALPFSSWSIIASPVPTPANGVYTFIDNGQTGPPASAKFFRLYEYP